MWQCKWLSLVGKFATNASGAIWWSNLELMQVEPPLAGEITQVLDALPWVRCASGNVLLSHRFFLHFPISCFFLFSLFNLKCVSAVTLFVISKKLIYKICEGNKLLHHFSMPPLFLNKEWEMLQIKQVILHQRSSIRQHIIIHHAAKRLDDFCNGKLVHICLFVAALLLLLHWSWSPETF